MTPRGIRNKNPGNIERNAMRWQGMAKEQTDPRFVVFESMAHGVRAAAKVLLTYYRKHKLNTVRGIINRWAPMSENNTGAYIRAVCKAALVEPDQPLPMTHEQTLRVLLRAIFHHENGGHFVSDADIAQGVKMALEGVK